MLIKVENESYVYFLNAIISLVYSFVSIFIIVDTDVIYDRRWR